MKKWYELGPFTVFDLETTGMSPTKNRIVEVAAVRINLDGTQQRFHSLVNPEQKIHPAASRVHRITDQMVSEAPLFSVVGTEFVLFADGSILVAHNARFDLSFLQESLARCQHPLWAGKTMDTIPVIKRAFPDLPGYSLSYLRERFGLGGNGAGQQAHRAFNDVEWTVEIFRKSMEVLLKAAG